MDAFQVKSDTNERVVVFARDARSACVKAERHWRKKDGRLRKRYRVPYERPISVEYLGDAAKEA